MACVVYDNNICYTNWSAEEKFGLFHREQGTFEPESLVNAFINAAKSS